MQMLVHIGLLYIVKMIKLFVSIVFELNIFLKKLKTLLEVKISKQLFSEYNKKFE